MNELVKSRAKGGHKGHLRLRTEFVSLCGHKPENTRRMRRAGWRNYLPGFGPPLCAACLKVAARKGLTVPEDF